MPKTIDREELKKKMGNGENFTLVDVLSEDQYDKSHIKGAINIPLEKIGRKAENKLNKEEEIVVYCSDKNCSASPNAAKKLESLGFKNVYDYEEGKADWKKAGYPMES